MHRITETLFKPQYGKNVSSIFATSYSYVHLLKLTNSKFHLITGMVEQKLN